MVRLEPGVRVRVDRMGPEARFWTGEVVRDVGDDGVEVRRRDATGLGDTRRVSRSRIVVPRQDSSLAPGVGL